ncbi:MAG: DNA polymerase III subunit alpha [Pseudomonadota bacterium]
MAFAHLHVHSQYTLLDGAFAPGDAVARAAALGQPAMALTDRCNLYGAVEFYKAAKGAGIHAIIGSELTVQPEGIAYKDPKGLLGGWSLVLLVEDEQGYRNLSSLITRAIFDGMHHRPRVDLALLHKHREGLIALTSGVKGPIGRALTQGHPEEARARVQALGEIFGEEHLYVELQDIGLPRQREINQLARALAAEHGLHTVVTNAVHYLRPQDVVTQQVLHAIGAAEALDGPERLVTPTDQAYLKSEEELREVFPEDGDAIERSVAIADRCRFAFTFGSYHFPATTPPDTAEEADTDANWAYFYKAFPPPRDFGLPDPAEAIPPRPPGAGNLNGYFRWYSEQGLALRLPDLPAHEHQAYLDRLERELGIIIQMQFPAYLLIVAEFINWAKDHGIPVGPGRGSAAGSVVAWAMRITDVDPIRFTLLFERFLNPDRVSMPDIDVDFCQDRREEAIEHVREKYGSPLVSQIITYGKLKAKAALKDVARVLSLNFNEADRITKLVPNELDMTLEKALLEPAFQALAAADPRVLRVVALARQVEGMTRQTGVHAAGVVIADQPLETYAPLYRDSADGGPVVQYEMKAAESVGLIKFDFLGLKTLDQIRDAVAMIERNTGERIDMARIPLDDPETYALLTAGDSMGVFQVESDGMQKLLQRIQPQSIEEAVALIALYRPGPLQSGMVEDFIECKHGRKEIQYPLPQLEPILKPTYGVVLYQEQVMQVAQVLSGYSLGEADLLRRAMGKKKKEEMDKQAERFLSGAEKNGIHRQKAAEIFELLAKFAGYGFNKSHSAAYGIVAYQTAWLKAHHRAEYMAALMSIEADNSDKVVAYQRDCKQAGIAILPPDANQSQAAFDVPAKNRRSIRYGLGAVKNVGSAAVEVIIKARREAGGRFRDLGHFLDKVDLSKVNKRVIESLIKAGAFDWTGLARAAMMAGLDDAMRVAQQAQETRASGQVSLFGAATAPLPAFRFPDVPEWATGERLANEREALGFFLSGHPLEPYMRDLARHITCTLDRLPALAPAAGAPRDFRNRGNEVTVAGMVSGLRTIRTQRGRMAFATLADPTGTADCSFFGEVWEQSREVLQSERPVLIRGRIEQREGREAPTLKVESVQPISELLSANTREVRLYLRRRDLSPRKLEALVKLLGAFPGGCTGSIELDFDQRATVHLRAPASRGLAPDDALRTELEALFGRADVVRFL